MDAKRFMTCATLFAGLLLLNVPLNGAVQSPIVGYSTMTLKNGSNLVAIPFEQLENPEAGYPIANLNIENLSTGLLSGHKIYIWDRANNRFKFYKYTVNGWQDADGNIVTADDEDARIYPQQAYLISGRSQEGTPKTTFSGKVITKDVTLSLETGSNHIANPYVAALPITSIQGNFGTGVLSGNKIFRWTGNKYDQYRWTTDGWKKVIDTAGNTEADVTPDFIEAGEGFILSGKAVDVTLKTPINLK